MNDYKKQIQQKEDELNEIKQNADEKHNQILKAHREDIMNQANAEHNRILGEKDKEMQELKEKYSELDKKYNETFQNLPHYVKAEAIKISMKHIGEKDQEIQRLQERINQLLIQQASQRTEMEMEEPKTKPEIIEIEEKTVPHSTHGMQTRSQGPPSFGEKVHQEEYDPLGNLTWKGDIYKIPNMRDYRAYEVVVNLINYSTGKNKIFKENFANYARDMEDDKRVFNNDGYVDKAVEILANELNNDNQAIAIAMKHILEKNPKALAEFGKIYDKQYAHYLKK